MKKEELDEIISNTDIKIIEKTEKQDKKRFNVLRTVAAAAALFIVIGTVAVVPAVMRRGKSPDTLPDVTENGEATVDTRPVQPYEEHTVVEIPFNEGYGKILKYDPVYPETIKITGNYVTAEEARKLLAERSKYYGNGTNLRTFFNSLASAVTKQSKKENAKNVVMSPLNIYMTLSMIAEITDGETREEILKVLNVKDIEELRDRTKKIWLAHYCDDGTFKSLLADSVWLDNDGSLSFSEEKIKTLTQEYFASVFNGDLQSDDFKNAYRTWLSDQTGGLMKNVIDGIEAGADTAMILASTVDFEAEWKSGYTEERGVFYTAEKKIDIKYLKTENREGVAYFGDGYVTVYQKLDNSAGTMWYILPDEGKTVDEILEKINITSPSANTKPTKEIHLTIRVPKLDISMQTDLKPALTSMGIAKCFDPSFDFASSVSNTAGNTMRVTKAIHGCRVLTTTEGVTGAAFAHFEVAPGAADPSTLKEYKFTADRPFIFVINSDDGLPLFFGIVNEP